MAQEYDLDFSDISEIEKILSKFNITIFEGRNIVQKINDFI